MTGAGVFLCLWALLLASRGTAFGAELHRFMVERPAARLSRVGRGHVAVAVTSAILVGFLIWAGGDDAVRMLGMAAPDAAAWLSTVELSALADVLVATAAAFSAVRFASVRGWLAGIGARAGRRSRPRSRARRRPAERVGADNDDDRRPARLAA